MEQAILPGDRASLYDSFIGKIVLIRPFLGDSREDSAHLFRSQGGRALSISPRRQSFISVLSLTLSPSVVVSWYKLLPFDLLSSSMLCDAHQVFKSRVLICTKGTSKSFVISWKT